MLTTEEAKVRRIIKEGPNGGAVVLCDRYEHGHPYSELLAYFKINDHDADTVALRVSADCVAEPTKSVAADLNRASDAIQQACATSTNPMKMALRTTGERLAELSFVNTEKALELMTLSMQFLSAETRHRVTIRNARLGQTASEITGFVDTVNNFHAEREMVGNAER